MDAAMSGWQGDRHGLQGLATGGEAAPTAT